MTLVRVASVSVIQESRAHIIIHIVELHCLEPERLFQKDAFRGNEPRGGQALVTRVPSLGGDFGLAKADCSEAPPKPFWSPRSTSRIKDAADAMNEKVLN